jgi:hypothetical protein
MRTLILALICALTLVFLFTAKSPFNVLTSSFPTYDKQAARAIFEPYLPVKYVMTGVFEGPGSARKPSCTVAIVGLGDSAPMEPPKIALADRDPLGFGGQWQTSPETTKVVADLDPLVVCRRFIDTSTDRLIQIALTQIGAFVIRDWKNKVLQIYAPLDQMAVYIRYREDQADVAP